MRGLLAFVAVAFFGNANSACANSEDSLAAHRAIYDVSLDHTTGADLVAAKGRLAIQVKNTCDGWSTAQRLIADLTDSNGTLTRTDYFTTSWESKDGHTMRFDVADARDGKVHSRVRGSATIGADGAGRAQLTSGTPTPLALPKGTEFPTTQLLDILRAAQRGQTSYKHIVYQGGDKDSLNFTTAVIGKPANARTLAADRNAEKAGPVIHDLPAWPVLISSFPINTRAEQPDFEVATHLFSNGVSGSMSLVYPTYVLKAKLVRLEALYPSC